MLLCAVPPCYVAGRRALLFHLRTRSCPASIIGRMLLRGYATASLWLAACRDGNWDQVIQCMIDQFVGHCRNLVKFSEVLRDMQIIILYVYCFKYNFFSRNAREGTPFSFIVEEKSNSVQTPRQIHTHCLEKRDFYS
jgi:hypothetical protein